jgi:hypothetical protein
MAQSMKGLKYVMRSCIKQDLIASRLKMGHDYSLHSINQDAIAVEGGDNPFSGDR